MIIFYIKFVVISSDEVLDMNVNNKEIQYVSYKKFLLSTN